MLIVFDDMIANMLSNKKLNPIVTELFIRIIYLFSCFYHTIVFHRTKKYQIKFNTLTPYENSKKNFFQ